MVCSGEHLRGDRFPDSVSNSLSERPRGRFDPLRLVKLRMPRRLRIERTKALQLVERERISGEMKPCVEEHAPVARRQNESIAVDPAWLGGIVT
jgi:hypothetical protein